MKTSGLAVAGSKAALEKRKKHIPFVYSLNLKYIVDMSKNKVVPESYIIHYTKFYRIFVMRKLQLFT